MNLVDKCTKVLGAGLTEYTETSMNHGIFASILLILPTN